MIRIASMVGAPDLQTPTLAPYSGDLALAFSRLSALGYDGVELMLRRPAELNGVWLRELLKRHHLELVALCTGHVFGEDGLGLVGADLNLNPLAFQRAKEFIDFAYAYLKPGTLINLGRFRGAGDPAQPEKSLEAYAQAFQLVADYALPKGVRLILEPVSRSEVHFIHSSQDGLEMVRRVDRSNFGVMLDTYHMQREDKNPLDSLCEAGSLCWHLHFSDSNRCYPSSADIRFDQIVDTLVTLGYNGYIGLEIKPWPTPDMAARNSIEHLRTFIPLGV